MRRRAARGLRRAYGACRARGGAASCVCGRPACAGEAERAGGRGHHSFDPDFRWGYDQSAIDYNQTIIDTMIVCSRSIIM